MEWSEANGINNIINVPLEFCKPFFNQRIMNILTLLLRKRNDSTKRTTQNK